MKNRFRFLAGFGLALIAVIAMGQAAIQTFPPNSLFGRIGVNQYGPGGAVPLATVAANLGIGVPANSVVIGKGSTVAGFNGATTGTAGRLLIDQGSGVDPSFQPMSGSCTLAASGAISCSTVGSGVTSVSANYSAASSDCLKTIAVSGGTQVTVSFASAATYGPCVIDVSNTNSWASPAGVVLSVTGITTDPPVLYPGMTITLINVSGVWFQKPGVAVSRAPVGTKLFVDGVNGLDSNDCLTTATACATLQHVVMEVIFKSLDASPGSATGGNAGFDVRLIDNPACQKTTGVNCVAGLHMSGMPRRSEGHNSIMIECDSGSAANCTIADASGGQAVGMYCACFLELQNVGLAGGSGNNNAVQVEKGMVRIEGSGVIVYASTGNPQLSAIEHGSIFVDGGATLNVAGGGSYLAQSARGGVIAFDSATIKWIANATYSSGTINPDTLAAISASSTTWNTNGFTVTAPVAVHCGMGGIAATGGASIPGTSTSNCAASAQGQYN